LRREEEKVRLQMQGDHLLKLMEKLSNVLKETDKTTGSVTQNLK